VFKENENTKELRIKKLFSNEDKDAELINEIKQFLEKSVKDISTDFLKTNISAKEAYSILKTVKNKDFEVIGQTIDTRFKCRYLITKNNTIIPVIPSGIIIEIPILCFNENNNINDCFSKIKFNNIDITNKNLEEIYKISNKFINVKPIGLFYDSIDNDMANIIGIITSNNDLVPVQQVKVSIKELEENKVLIQNRPLYHDLDIKLSTYDKNNVGVIDERIKNINSIK
jgi:predicted mannosyl-3-phosphoglycerate phosphatase (HAD superfamily)